MAHTYATVSRSGWEIQNKGRNFAYHFGRMSWMIQQTGNRALIERMRMVWADRGERPARLDDVEEYEGLAS